ncbi:MAG: acetyl-CoA carboxylase biotin carboxyl carrier protein [Phycisphaerales bacterium]|nr:acetyl-CoA carboxylase biotin carboxyl carrier protein [Phycisphaerales bacterium]MCB9856796.1 acetyl-CoA carboxylase biotin carboxyl carrier protein [Phycisphaerales bacterium]MCB9862077.1 acetyl-CoA carboxylase biotin carboxyl carrier protein [Phycisphaerales bacterium]
MDIEEIKTLTDLMVENDLSEIVIRDGEKRILLRRRGAHVEHAPMPPIMAMTPAAAPVPAAPQAAPAAAPSGSAAEAGLDSINSPMVGTFYTASDPESPPFVKPGDKVTPDTVVCIIEAMKVFNEIKAEKSGTIVSVDVANAAPVEFGQVLMKIRPD